MTSSRDYGFSGEAIACTHLENTGYTVLEKNWRYGHDEIDLIVEKGEFIVFAEVKTRRSTYFGEPEMFVTKAKQRNMIRAANNYLRQNQLDKEVRFDIVAVVLNASGHQIHHVENAFYPTL